jgi:ribosomal protein S18 acetylase RimI-like enzyme
VATRTDNQITTVRTATWSEAPDIGQLLRRAYAEHATDFPWPTIWEPYAASVADVVGRWGDSTILVAELDAEVVGSVDYHPPSSGVYSHAATTELIEPADRAAVHIEPTWAAVRCLAVDPACRGRGIARALMDELIARARRDGANLVFLHSVPNMTSAIELYQSLGFVRMPERDFRIAGGGRTAALAFHLDLRRS